MEIEEIPNADIVSRLLENPRTYDRKLLDAVFEFINNEHESVIWRKHAPDDTDVHRYGCEWEASKRERRPNMRYVGFISVDAGAIRGIRTAKGHGFLVIHRPEEGVQHAGIEYDFAPGAQSPGRGEKTELKLILRNVFGSLQPHSCQAA